MQSRGINRGTLVIAAVVAIVLVAGIILAASQPGGLFGTAANKDGGGQGQGNQGGNQGGGNQGGGNQGNQGNSNQGNNQGNQGNSNQGNQGNSNQGGNQGQGSGNQGGGDQTKGHQPITICHATGSATNPYVTITVDTNSTDFQGHAGHADDLIPAPAGGCPSDKTPDEPKKVTICHIPPGNPANAHEITISVNALPAHLAHGDAEGACTTLPTNTPGTSTPTLTPTDTPDEVCGADTEGANLPSFDDPACNEPDDDPEPEKPVWNPIQLKPATCPDWTLYHTNIAGPWNIYRVSGAGDVVNVSKGIGDNVKDLAPSRSPDGNWVSFTTNRDGNWEVYVTDAQGGQQQRVTFNSTAADISPMWSPDGKFIVYQTTRHGSRDLYMVEVASRTETRLTDSPGQDVNAFWSPDSKTVLFQSDRDGLWQVYALEIATLRLSKLSTGENNDLNPQFSSTGKEVAYRSYSTGSANTVIYVANADGSNAHAVSDTAASATNHAFSPDGSLIAYQANQGDQLGIYVYDSQSKNTRQVTETGNDSFAPTWRCNTNILVFTADSSGNTDIFSTSALPINKAPVKLEETLQLTFDESLEQYPMNSPAVEDASQRSQIGNPSN